MEEFLKYQLSYEQQRSVVGGVAEASATCKNGATVSCSGGVTCNSADVNETTNGWCHCTDSSGMVVDEGHCQIPD